MRASRKFALASRAAAPRGAVPAPARGATAPWRALPWAAAQEQRLRALLGHSLEADRVIELAANALAQSSVKTYTSHWRAFEAYCAAAGRSALPASQATVALYVAHLAQRGTINPNSLQPYLSAINSAHKAVLLDPEGPARGPLLDAVRRGWRREANAVPRAQKERSVALPAHVVSTAMQRALALGASRTPQLLRALWHTTLGFATLMRAGSTVPLAHDDVALTATELVVRPRYIKNGQLNALLPDAKRFPKVHCRQMSSIHLIWRSAQMQAWATARQTPPAPSADRSYWALPGDAHGDASRTATAWLLEACDALGAVPPLGGKYSSHCLRKGGASAAWAVGLPYDNICVLGDWKIGSQTPRRHYIDYTVVKCATASLLFAFRLPGAPTR